MISGIELFLGLINNLAIFIILIAVYGALDSYFLKSTLLKRQMVFGFVFGFFAIACMFVKIPVAAGVIVDQRNTIVVLSGAFGGPLSAIICALMTGAFRIFLGGNGVLGGVVGVGLAAFSGIGLFYFRGYINSILKAFFVALAATIILFPSFLFVGDFQTGWELLKALALPYGLASFIGIFIVGLLLAHEEHRHIAEAKRKESEKQYRDLFENLIDVSYRTDNKGNFTVISPSSEMMFGYHPNEVLGRQIANFYRHSSRRDDFLVEIKQNGYVKNFEAEIRKKDGSFVWVSTNAKVLIDSKGAFCGIEGVTRDISQIKKAEEEKRGLEESLRQSQKMEAIGLMAGGVAHDLNNILSGVVAYPDLILAKLPKDSELEKPIKAIQQAGKRAADVVADLLTVAQKSTSTREITTLNRLVVEYLQSLEGGSLLTLYPDVTIETELSDDLLNVSCSTVHVKKCLMNLVTNAAEAIGETGTITISTKNRYIDQPFVFNQYLDKGEYVIVSVLDSGSGIAAEDVDHIFEPFYSKKMMGRSGTGLGLAIVWNTVHEHAGTVTVSSDEGGTLFELYFPASRGQILELPQTVPKEAIMGSNEHILVVDDEPQQREIASQILESLGYRVDAVSCGEDAVHFVRECPVDLLILDMIMGPGINGRKTYEMILQFSPDQKAILVSGFSEDEEVQKVKSLGNIEFVKKPYTLLELGQAVKNEVSGRSLLRDS